MENEESDSSSSKQNQSSSELECTCSEMEYFKNPIDWLRRREINYFPRGYSQENDLKNTLYHKFGHEGNRDGSVGRYKHGGIFGLDFSPDGSILVAACENKSILLMDPLMRNVIRTVEGVHADCVNTIKFLDGRLFTTCSDDHTVKLWDARLLKAKQPIRTFNGHQAWVKNIEYIPSEGILLTSAFDDKIYSWEINTYHEGQADEFKRVWNCCGLIRMCLTNDKSKMIVSSQSGYLVVIHNFNVHSCNVDLTIFNPHTSWMVLNSEEPCRKSYGPLLNSKNRPELIIDFPPESNPRNITALTPHPYDWCVLSRFTNSSENAEWTCVHDIQLPPAEYFFDPDFNTSPEEADSVMKSTTSQPYPNGAPGYFILPPPAYPRTARMSTGGGRRAPGLYLPYVVMASRLRREMRQQLNSGTTAGTSVTSDGSKGFFVPKSYRRLTHYIDEAYAGRGYIKEQSFSSDGRLIASPFGNGVRLLAFDDKCSELCQVSPLRGYDTGKNKEESSQRFNNTEPIELTEIRMNVSHKTYVLCAQFSPNHCLLASGCLNGKVTFQQPVL